MKYETRNVNKELKQAASNHSFSLKGLCNNSYSSTTKVTKSAKKSSATQLNNIGISSSAKTRNEKDPFKNSTDGCAAQGRTHEE